MITSRANIPPITDPMITTTGTAAVAGAGVVIVACWEPTVDTAGAVENVMGGRPTLARAAFILDTDRLVAPAFASIIDW